jgi:hypothetical protein
MCFKFLPSQVTTVSKISLWRPVLLWDFTKHRMIVYNDVSEHPIHPVIFNGHTVQGRIKSQKIADFFTLQRKPETAIPFFTLKRKAIEFLSLFLK